jgi:hypothetical protein
VLTALAYVSPYGTRDLTSIDSHGCEIVSHISQTSDLFHLGRSLVELGTQSLAN